MARPKVLSLFSGAGGIDYGFEAAGFDTGCAVEIDEDCCETLRASRPAWKDRVVCRDVFQVPTDEMLERAGGLKPKAGDVACLVGGAPCQPWSKSGYWASGETKRLADPRANTLRAFLRVWDEALPQAVCFENVEGFGYAGKNEGFKLLLDGIKEINRKHGTNYVPHCTEPTISAASVGCPQDRRRFFLVAHIGGKPFRFPEATHGDAADEPEVKGELFKAPRKPLLPFKTAWDALGDEEPTEGDDLAMRGKYQTLLPSIPEGANYLWFTRPPSGKQEWDPGEHELFGWRRRYWNFLLKLAKNRPSWTIQAQPGPAVGPFHWKSRRLSKRELCRLMTFPDDVVIPGSWRAAQKQCGNAVPSLLAEVMAREIRRQLLGLSVRGAPKLLPPDRGPAPKAETPAPLPPEWKAKCRRFSAHPGTGLGNAAIARKKTVAVAPLLEAIAPAARGV